MGQLSPSRPYQRPSTQVPNLPSPWVAEGPLLPQFSLSDPTKPRSLSLSLLNKTTSRVEIYIFRHFFLNKIFTSNRKYNSRDNLPTKTEGEEGGVKGWDAWLGRGPARRLPPIPK